MSKIVAAGLTPAWQQTLCFDRLQPGEVNRARRVHWCGSGKVLNVGAALGMLGAPAVVVAPLGGPIVESIEQEFAALGLCGRWQRTPHSTRVCTTLLDESTGVATELVENAAPLDDDSLVAFRAHVAEVARDASVVVLSGSLPANVSATLYRDLLRLTSAQAILDARGPELMAALECRPLVVKPNREELGRTVGRRLESTFDVLAAMHELNATGAQWVVVTQGAGPVLATSDGRSYQADPPHDEQVVNPIGCGDSLAAGLAAGLAGGFSVLEALPLGMGAAAANLHTPLPARFDRDLALRLARGVVVREFVAQ